MRFHLRNALAAWNRFWFTPADPTSVAAIRICTGLGLFYAYAACTADLQSFLGPRAWVDASAIEQLRRPVAESGEWWGQSIYFYVQSPSAIWLIHAMFLASIIC